MLKKRGGTTLSAGTPGRHVIYIARMYFSTMIGNLPKTGQDTGPADSAGAALPGTTGTTVSEVHKIESLLRSVGKDPSTTSLGEAREIVQLLENARCHKEKKFYTRVLVVLGIFVIAAVAGMVILAFFGKAIPDGLIALGSAALGLFAGILVAASCRDNDL